MCEQPQAATCSWSSVVVTGSPSLHTSPALTRAMSSGAFTRRKFFSATMSTFQMRQVAFSVFRKRRAAPVRNLTAAKGLSTGLAVRRCRQRFVVPAALLFGLGEDLGQSRPHSAVAAGHHQGGQARPRSRRSRKTAPQLSLDSR